MSLSKSLGKSSSSTTSSGTTNQTANTTGSQTNNPWEAVTPYITGQGGLLDSAQGVFQQGQAGSSGIRDALSQQAQDIINRSGGANAINNAGMGLLGANLPQAQQITGQWITDVPKVGAQQVGVLDSFGKLGSIDPTKAFQGQLSGDVTNSYIADQLKANTDSTTAAYQNLLGDATDNLTRNILPSIRSGANLSGGYGGSRQGIAEGVAIGDTNKQLTRSADSLAASLGQTNANVLSGAYENAQNRQGTAAQFLGGLGVGTDTNNADRQLAADQFNAKNALDTSMFNVNQGNDLSKFNAGVTLNNNAQNIGAIQTGAGLLGQASDVGNSNLQGLLGALQGGQAYDQNNLNSYGGLLGSLAGLGGTTNSTGTSNIYGTNTSTGKKTDTPSTLAQAGQVAQLAALFSDIRLKENVREEGQDHAGRRLISYNYVWDAPSQRQRGVVAQEVLKTDPQAVSQHASGYLMVDYAQLEAA